MFLLLCAVLASQDPLFQATSLLNVKLFATAIDSDDIRSREDRLVEQSTEASRWIGVANAYADVNAFRQAEQVLTRGMDVLGPRPELLRERGRRRISLRLFREAQEDLTKAAQQASNDDLVFYYLGLTKYFLGDWAGAIDAYEHGLKVAPQDGKAKFFHWMTWAFSHAGDAQGVGRVIPANAAEFKHAEVFATVMGLRSGKLTVRAVRASPQYKTDGRAILEYAVGEWYVSQGDIKAAEEAFSAVLKQPEWGYFAYVAAEVWLAGRR